jgi:hypothetical protein
MSCALPRMYTFTVPEVDAASITKPWTRAYAAPVLILSG